MNNSKWNYIAMGVAAMGALLGAFVHSGLGLVVNLFFVVFNWYIAENKRADEEATMINIYELTRQEQEKND